MGEIKWIKIVTNVFDNRKIKMIESMPEGDSIIVVWFKLLCLAGQTNDGGAVYFAPEIPFTTEMLAVYFNRPLPIVRLAFEAFQQFGMIHIEDEVIKLSSWEKYQNVEGMEKIREQNRIRKQRQREKEQFRLESHDTSRDMSRDVTQQNKNKNKNKHIERNQDKEADKKEVDIFFENIWKEYPEKKGKSQISQTTRRKLHKVGAETLLRAIRNYEDDLRQNDWKKPMHGSTFFNGRYEDYLQVEEKPKVQFLNIGDDDDAL